MEENIKELRQYIDTEMTDEWWKDGNETFLNAAKSMLNHGMDIDLIKTTLGNLYDAVAQEYS